MNLLNIAAISPSRFKFSRALKQDTIEDVVSDGISFCKLEQNWLIAIEIDVFP
jgi:hypothetical protein